VAIGNVPVLHQGRDRRSSIRRQKVPGRGSLHHSTETRRIVVSFDEETFGEVRGLALKAGTSFAEQARLLVEFGLEAVERV
jgi:hypothetical protein